MTEAFMVRKHNTPQAFLEGQIQYSFWKPYWVSIWLFLPAGLPCKDKNVTCKLVLNYVLVECILEMVSVTQQHAKASYFDNASMAGWP